MDSASGIIFMRGGIPKINKQSVAQILRNIAFVAFNDLGADLLIGSYDSLEFFGVELL